MPILTKMEQPRSRILLATPNIPAQYHQERLAWWTSNSPTWSEHIDADLNRGMLLESLALRSRDFISSLDNPIVTDVGCGEGAFLRAIRSFVPHAVLQGIDFCPAMLAQASSRSVGASITYALGDLELAGFAPERIAHLVTSILSVDEMEQVGRAFHNIASSIFPGGTAMVVIMDPTKEVERNRADLEAYVTQGAVDEPVLLVKTFPRAGLEPAAPYCRIVRPLAQYIGEAAKAGLELLGIEHLSHHVGLGAFSDALLFDILKFRKG
ncbi:MAG: methyltransferase domain-containing protein [Acidobacteria bacterium]|nr:methyltransferase domain-containing protein [Acidobacteriota bacterium]